MSLNRILVIGCSGSGKSTLSKKISKQFDLPYISLDKEFWQEGWVITQRDSWRLKVQELLAKHDRWVMDGSYSNSLDLRLPLAERIYYFQLPRWQCLLQSLRRCFITFGRVRSDMAAGCPEKIDFGFYRYIWRFKKDEEPVINKAIEKYGSHCKVVILKSLQDAEKAYADLVEE